MTMNFILEFKISFEMTILIEFKTKQRYLKIT